MRVLSSAGLALPLAVALLVAAGCGGDTKTKTTATTATTAAAQTDQNTCPQIVDWSSADFYPIQPSFSAGYQLFAQKNDQSAAKVGYIIDGDFPYSNWMAWYVYSGKGVPLAKLADKDITPQPGSTNPTVNGKPVLAPKRSYQIYVMPKDTPSGVQSQMQDEGKNVMLLPALKGTSGGSGTASIVGRSYWAFEGYNRSGYDGPTNTPFPELHAYKVGSDGQLTNEPADCSFHTGLSRVPEKLQFDTSTEKPVISFAKAPKQADFSLRGDLPDQKIFTGGEIGRQKAPRPDPDAVSFFRNPVLAAPYADVESVPGYGSPPDACGGYVMANLVTDKVALVRVPQMPTYADYSGATASTLNESDNVDVQFYSFVVYGAAKQLDKVGSPDNSQIGNTQIRTDSGGGATVMVWPRKASQSQQEQLFAYAKAHGWNILKGGIETAFAPNAMVIREKGQNSSWKYALSANPVTKGAPCPQTTDPSITMPENPPSAVVTQKNGMGLSAPQGAQCSIGETLSGGCESKLKGIIKDSGGVFSAGGTPGA